MVKNRLTDLHKHKVVKEKPKIPVGGAPNIIQFSTNLRIVKKRWKN